MFLSIVSLGSFNKWLYFLKICIIPINIQTATQIIHANQNRETLKLAEIRKTIENTKTENMFENQTSPELNVS